MEKDSRGQLVQGSRIQCGEREIDIFRLEDREFTPWAGGNVWSIALVIKIKILKGARAKRKRKRDSFKHCTASLPNFYFGTLPHLSLSIGVTGKRKRCRLYSSDRKTSKEKKSSESRLKHVQKALNYLWYTRCFISSADLTITNASI